jgi:hypothetical protein
MTLAATLAFGAGCLFSPKNIGQVVKGGIANQALEFLLDNDAVFDLFED